MNIGDPPWGSPPQSAPWPRPSKEKIYIFFKIIWERGRGSIIVISRWIRETLHGSQSRTGGSLQGCGGGRTS